VVNFDIILVQDLGETSYSPDLVAKKGPGTEKPRIKLPNYPEASSYRYHDGYHQRAMRFEKHKVC